MAERGHRERDDNARAVQADEQVSPGGESCQRPGDGHVAERVAGEHLRPQHHEIAGQAGSRGDGGAGDEGITQEWLAEQAGEAAHAGTAAAGQRLVRRNARPAAARTYPAKPKVVMKKPTG